LKYFAKVKKIDEIKKKHINFRRTRDDADSADNNQINFLYA